MKKILMLALSLGIISGSAKCTEADLMSTANQCYFKSFGGVNWISSPTLNKVDYSTDKGYILGASLGRQFKVCAVEGEYAYRHNIVAKTESTLASADLDQHTGIINGVIELPFDYHLVPYAGVGMGYRYIKTDQNYHEWCVYQVKAGMNISIADRVKLFADYRLMNSFYKNSCMNQDICGGLKVTF